MNSNPQIEYLNTDLDLVATCSLEDLRAEMVQHGLFGRATPCDDGTWYAMFEDCNADEPEPNIINLLDALDQLSPAATQVLQQCTRFEFNIGYDCGAEPLTVPQTISHATLRRIVEHGASIRITLYPYRPHSDTEITHVDLTDEDNASNPERE
ncbi:MAG: hypothetical protein JNK90_27130 [Planctomycetaceae bacterium]|nr:hypothetical protein [Planctomycetaceae bacterium]